MLRFLVLLFPVLLAGCAISPESTDFAMGSPNDCEGVSVVVNFGILSKERTTQCVELLDDEALAVEILNFAGYQMEGTDTFGDQVVCRVNGLPSKTEAFVVEGEQPHVESCADMPPAFGYWALWSKSDDEADWGYAEAGVGTLVVTTGESIGLVFSTGGETPVPSDP
ncbi:MAG: hypothetical protein ACI84A_000154 [Pontimonas sp.]|jgi:hypothetical protein